MAIMQIDHGTDKYELMVKLREEILRRPLGLSFSPADLDRDKNDILIGAFDEGRILGCCILHEIAPDCVKLRQMAVSKTQQGKGIGNSLMMFAENLARDKGYRKITMNARDTALGFYRQLGYKVVGESFIEVTVPHHKMEKTLR